MESKTAIDSVAVLPFTTEGNDPMMEDLGDGITAKISLNLKSRLPQLRVMSLDTMSHHYKGQSVEAQKVGSDLGVRAVLIGKVFKRGNTLTVQTELVDILNRSHLWGEEYTRDQPDIIGGISSSTLKEEISNQILDKLKVKLLDGTKTD